MNVVRRLRGGKLWHESVHDLELEALVRLKLHDREIAARMGFEAPTIQRQRIRLGLLVKDKPYVYTPVHAAPPPPKEEPNPMAEAKRLLGTRLTSSASAIR